MYTKAVSLCARHGGPRPSPRLARDRRGALEGMPLYLLILGVVAAIGIAIMLVWLFLPDDPTIIYVEANPGTLMAGEDAGSGRLKVGDGNGTVRVYVYDQDKVPVQGATVIAEGAGIYKHGTTDGQGRMTLDLADAYVVTSRGSTSSVKIQATFGDMEAQTSVLIVRAE